MARPKKVSDEEILEEIEDLNVPVVTAGILSERLSLTRSGVSKRLNQLVEEEKVGCLSKGGRARCWWSAEDTGYQGGFYEYGGHD